MPNLDDDPSYLSANEIAIRLGLLDLTHEDRLELIDAWAIIAPHCNALVEEMYRHFSATSEISSLFENPQRIRRLKQEQYEYLQQLYCGSFDQEYVQRRTVVGRTHHRLQVSPQWYLAAYAWLFARQVDILLENLPNGQTAGRWIVTLLKSMFFDAGLVLESYGHTEESLFFERSRTAHVDSSSSRHVQDEGSIQSGSPLSIRRPLTRLNLSKESHVERMDFIGLDSKDQQILRQQTPQLDAVLTRLLDVFYDSLEQVPKLSEMVTHRRGIALHQRLSQYWRNLFQAEIDGKYAAERMRIGVIHEEIGLEPHWYLVGLGRQTADIVQALSRDGQLWPGVKSLVRAVVFDVTFVMDAFMEARAQSLVYAEGIAGRVMSGLNSAVAVFDQSQRIQFANERFVDLVDIQPGLLYLMSVADAVEEPEMAALIQRASTERESKIIEWKSSHWLVSVMTMGHEEERRRPETVLILDDVTPLLKFSSDSQRDSERWNVLFQELPIVAWEMEIQSQRIVLLSRPTSELLRVRDTEILGCDGFWINAIIPEDRDRFHAACRAALQRPRVECEYRMRRGDGQQLWLRTVLSTSGCSPGTVNGITTDVTQLRLADQLRLAAIGKIAGEMAHRLNNSLTSVLNCIELYPLNVTESDDVQLITIARQSAEHAARIVKQLQIFSGGQLLRPRRTVLNDFLQGYATIAHRILGESVQVTWQFQNDVWNCRVDEEGLRDVLGNLLANARTAMPLGGQCTIQTRNLSASDCEFDDPGFNREWIELTVRDSGTGMPEDIRRRAVEPFFSNDAPAERNGLGLSMAHGFMLQSGGHMLIQSQLNHGTTVTLRFPRFIEPNQQHSSSGADESKAVVLVVDDDPMVLASTSLLVERSGYSVLVAESADEAMGIVQTRRVDILLSDIVLAGGGDGRILARQIQDRFPDLRIVLMTGYADSVVKSSIPEAWQVLAKPFSLLVLQSALQRAITAGL